MKSDFFVEGFVKPPISTPPIKTFCHETKILIYKNIYSEISLSHGWCFSHEGKLDLLKLTEVANANNANNPPHRTSFVRILS